MPHPQCRRFSCRSCMGPINGGWWWHHHWTRFSYHKWHFSSLFFWKGKRQTTLQQKIWALVGFEPRTEPELSTRDSHSTSAPLVHPSQSIVLTAKEEPQTTGSASHMERFSYCASHKNHQKLLIYLWCSWTGSRWQGEVRTVPAMWPFWGSVEDSAYSQGHRKAQTWKEV